ncbi:MAG: hypothetical protein MJZ66_04280 [Bacteroidales bacterium]|nr:hypothetical protein [Bacteroidales bacterium]
MENTQENFFVKVFERLTEFFKTKNVSQENENEALIEFALSKEDDAEHKDNPDPLTADDILEICKSIDHTNETIHEWYEQGQPDATEFGVNQIKDLAHEIDPELSDNEIEKEINKAVDESLINRSREFADIIAGEGNEITDEEMNEVVKQANKEEE